MRELVQAPARTCPRHVLHVSYLYIRTWLHTAHQCYRCLLDCASISNKQQSLLKPLPDSFQLLVSNYRSVGVSPPYLDVHLKLTSFCSSYISTAPNANLNRPRYSFNPRIWQAIFHSRPTGSSSIWSDNNYNHKAPQDNKLPNLLCELHNQRMQTLTIWCGLESRRRTGGRRRRMIHWQVSVNRSPNFWRSTFTNYQSLSSAS